MGLLSSLRAGRGPALAPLTPAPRVADLPDPVLRHAGRYLGTVAGGVRVRARGLGSAGAARIQLSEEGVDVIRLAGSFRIPTSELRSARGTMELAPLTPPTGGRSVLVIRWEHDETVLETGFRLEGDAVRERDKARRGSGTDRFGEGTHREWSRAVAKIGRSHDG